MSIGFVRQDERGAANAHAPKQPQNNHPRFRGGGVAAGMDLSSTRLCRGPPPEVSVAEPEGAGPPREIKTFQTVIQTKRQTSSRPLVLTHSTTHQGTGGLHRAATEAVRENPLRRRNH